MAASEFKTIKIPSDKFLEIMRDLSAVEHGSDDYKHYHEGVASVMKKLKPYLVESENKVFAEFNKKIYEFARKHEDEYAKLEREIDYDPHCQIDGCDRDGNCDGCPNCYSDECVQIETSFMKLKREFAKALRNKEITKKERDELVYRWKYVNEDYGLRCKD